MAALLTVDDLTDEDISDVLGRARALQAGGAPFRSPQTRVLATAFLEPSLRTRIGFATAAARLGWGVVDVFAQRGVDPASRESWSDTLRTLAAFADVIVARPARALGDQDRRDAGSSRLVNGGDVGPAAEHPTQALVDLFAIEALAGPIGAVRLAVVGDPRMRAVRSLLALLARRRPAALTLVADAEQAAAATIPAALDGVVRWGGWETIGDAQVLYVGGIPHESLPRPRRAALIVTADRLRSLPADCVVMSPMPIIDEMDEELRNSPRNAMYRQNELGLFVRMALLERLGGRAD